MRIHDVDLFALFALFAVLRRLAANNLHLGSSASYKSIPSNEHSRPAKLAAREVILPYRVFKGEFLKPFAPLTPQSSYYRHSFSNLYIPVSYTDIASQPGPSWIQREEGQPQDISLSSHLHTSICLLSSQHRSRPLITNSSKHSLSQWIHLRKRLLQ